MISSDRQTMSPATIVCPVIFTAPDASDPQFQIETSSPIRSSLISRYGLDIHRHELFGFEPGIDVIPQGQRGSLFAVCKVGGPGSRSTLRLLRLLLRGSRFWRGEI